MPQWTRRIGAIAAAAALASAAACSSSEGGDSETENPPPGEGTQTDLLELLNESDRLVAELVSAENRIIEQCLEDQGHTVHDQFTIMDIGGYESESLSLGLPTEGLFPEPDMAAKWGFGAWADTTEGMESPDYAEYDAIRNPDEPDDSGEAGGLQEELGSAIDNSAFDDLSEDERLAWYIAYGGEEYAAWQGYSDEELEEQYQDDEGVWTTPKPGGCLLEMIESLYGEPELIVDEEEGTTHWSGRPESPEFQGTADDEILPAYRERVADEESAFLECLIDRDRGAWEFSDTGELGIWGYFVGVYTGEWESGDGADYAEGTPGPPADLPADFEGKRQYETELAVDFTECAAESGFGEASVTEWEAVHLEYYRSIEPELFAWQDEIKTALDESQDLIRG